MVLTAGWLMRFLMGEHLVLGFGGKGGGTTTTVSDPAAQIAAEAKVNRYNTVSPFGRETWKQGGGAPSVSFEQWLSQRPGAQAKDPAAQRTQYERWARTKDTGGGQYTREITLDPSQQRQFDVRNLIAEMMLGRAKDQIPQIGATPFEFDKTGAVAKSQFDQQMDLMRPEFAKEDESFEQRQMNQGLPVGSEAYADAKRLHDNNRNFAISQASQSATQRGADLGLQQRQQQFNELAALLGGQQLNTVQSNSGAPLDVGGAYMRSQADRIAAANAAQSGRNSMMSGLFGLGSAAIPLMFAKPV